VRLIKALLAIGTALGLEALLGRLAPATLGYVDLMLVVVAYFALRGTQRSAMVTGCAGGLLDDTWFRAGVFGISGFKKTLEGWVVGGVATRFDLNHLPGRLVVGILLSVGDQFLDVGLYHLLGLRVAPLDPARIFTRAAIAGLLVAAIFPIVDRVTGREATRAIRRKA